MNLAHRRRQDSGDGHWAPLADTMTLVACVFLVVFLAAVLSHRSSEDALEGARQTAEDSYRKATIALSKAYEEKERADMCARNLRSIEARIGATRDALASGAGASGFKVDALTGAVVLEESLMFEPNGHELKAGAPEVVRSNVVPAIVRALRTDPGAHIVISGHTDCSKYKNDPDDIENWSLSLRRANAVLREVFRSADFTKADRLRVLATGKGDNALRVPEPCTSGENRRVEILVEVDYSTIQRELHSTR